MSSNPELQELFGPSFFVDPYRTYARLRRKAPVFFVEAWQAWAISRYADVATGFRDPRLSSNRTAGMLARFPAESAEQLKPVGAHLRAWALFADPPSHGRLRGLINKAFTPRVVEGLRPAIDDIARGLVDAAFAEGRREIDVVKAIATPLPVIVIGDLLGLPREDRHRLKAWSDTLATMMGSPHKTPELATATASTVREMHAYFLDQIAARRHVLGDDLLSHLVSAREDGKLLDDQELVSTCAMLLFAGHETTTNLIGNGLVALLRNPDQLDKLRALSTDDAQGWARAIDELLRFDAPNQFQGRIAREDLELDGQHVPAGSRVFLLMASANRDEDAFLSAHRLDIGRATNRHLSFGLGSHYCVGSALAHAEAKAAFSALLARAPRLELAQEEVRWIPNIAIRAVESLRVVAR